MFGLNTIMKVMPDLSPAAERQRANISAQLEKMQQQRALIARLERDDIDARSAKETLRAMMTESTGCFHDIKR